MNKLLQKWKNDKQVINGWLSIANPFTCEIMATTGKWDSITIDAQHGMVDFNSTLSMLQTIDHKLITPMVRVPWLSPDSISKYLDAGALGLICPMIENAKQVKEFIEYSSYPPIGVRSFGPTRARFAYGNDYFEQANKNIILLAMIETPEAFNNLEEICQVKGLTGVYIGPADLSLTHGLKPSFDKEDKEIIDKIQRIVDVAHANGIKAALHTGSVSYAKRALSWGFDMVTISNDVRLLSDAVSGLFDSLEK